MKHLYFALALLFFTSPLYAQETLSVQPKAKGSTYYFIRHAEKDRTDKTNRNPNLTQEGLLRAVKWSYILDKVAFDMVYTTDYNRTRQTATPTAMSKDLELTLYDPRKIDGKSFVQANDGKTVLVVGHSNTTPYFVNAILGNKKYEDIDDSNNANLYIVTVSASGEITDTLLVID